MNQIPQLIIAVGMAIFYISAGAMCVIWAMRCSPKLPHYRLPIMAAVLPAAGTMLWALLKLS